MRKIEIAEWIFSCAMPQANASAAAGDLAEFGQGACFFISVVRLAICASVRRLLQSPLHFLGMASLLWCACLMVTIIYGVAGSLLWAIIYSLDNHTGLELITDWLRHPIPAEPSPWLTHLWIVAMSGIAGWKLGAVGSRKAPGTELATWYAVAVVWIVFGLSAKVPGAAVFLSVAMALGGMLRSRWTAYRVSLR